jgi:hypothetical protein
MEEKNSLTWPFNVAITTTQALREEKLLISKLVTRNWASRQIIKTSILIKEEQSLLNWILLKKLCLNLITLKYKTEKQGTLQVILHIEQVSLGKLISMQNEWIEK